jgi:hypothetical protein
LYGEDRSNFQLREISEEFALSRPRPERGAEAPRYEFTISHS